MNKFAVFSRFAKNFFDRKIFQLQLLKSGVFWQKKYSAKFLKLRTELVDREVIHCISRKNFKNFSVGKKSNFKF